MKSLSKFISELNEKKEEINLYKRFADSIKKQDFKGVLKTLETGGQTMALRLGGFLDSFIKDQTEKILYKQLMSAIEAQDLEGVQKALKAGASAAYLPENDMKRNIETPLSHALDSNNTQIFEAVLNSKDGEKALSYGHDFCSYGKPQSFYVNISESEFDPVMQSRPSHLFVAIERKNEEIALLLSNHSKVDVENSGSVEILSYNDEIVLPKNPSPLKLAVQKGMGTVVTAIKERIENQNVSMKKQPAQTMAP